MYIGRGCRYIGTGQRGLGGGGEGGRATHTRVHVRVPTGIYLNLSHILPIKVKFKNKFVFSVVPSSHPSQAFPKQLHCRADRAAGHPGREQVRSLTRAGPGQVRQGPRRAVERE